MTRLFWMIVAAAMVAVAPVGASAEEGAAEPRLLSVSGEGVAHAAPDIALITLGAVSEAVSARDALDDNSATMTGLIDALKDEGLEDRDLQTSGFSVEPIFSQPPRDYDHSTPFRPEIVGYRVRNNVNVRIRDLERVGAILDLVVTLGANSITGPSFTVADPTPLEDEARRTAVADALRKAELYAEAADVDLGPIQSISEGYASAPQPMQAATMRMEVADSSVPIEGGELTFEVQVSVAWVLEE